MFDDVGTRTAAVVRDGDHTTGRGDVRKERGRKEGGREEKDEGRGKTITRERNKAFIIILFL